jgi:WD40 repeat protein
LTLVENLPDEILVLLWGATSFTHAPLAEFLLSNPSALSEITMPDWILDARAITPSTIGLVTAHNTLFIYSLEQRQIIQEINCEEQSLLYAGQIYRASDGTITIATGTVFNEIQVWHPFPTPHSSPSRSTVSITKRLQGHEGCIFSLRFNGPGNLLASCSDDRTIRVWNVTDGSCVAVGFGHIARVWDVRFLPDRSNEIFLMSTSEDTTAYLWNLSLVDRTLKVHEKYHGHGGKHVWSQAISSDGALAATGGNDGGVSIWDVAGRKSRIGDSPNEIYWTEKSPTVVVDGKEIVDVIKGYSCVDDDRFLMTTKSGYEEYEWLT